MVSASPLHRHRNGVRSSIELEKRYVVNGLFTEPVVPGKRHEQSAENTEAQNTQTVSSIDPFAVPTRQGTEDGRAPAVGVGGSNTSLLSLLTQALTITETARAQPSNLEQNAQQTGAPAGAGSGTAINPVGAAAVSTTTVQIQTTVLETVQVTVQATAAAALSSVAAPAGEAPGLSQQPAAQSAGPEVPTTASVVFITANPSSSAPTTESTTLDTAKNTATASDVIAAATTTTTAPAAPSTETVSPPQPATADAPIANSQLLGLGEDRTSTTTLASTTTEVIAATAAAAQESSAVNTSAATSTSSEEAAAAVTEPATVTIRPGLGSIPAAEARPATLSTASPPPAQETTDPAAPISTAAANSLVTAAPEQPSDSVTLAVVPVTIETVQQNQNAFTVTETQTVTTTVTAV
ncbi:uncharacterized protein A1O9_11476 [Exophiala aquamarina CBS 119918]|uniref:Uncharacterized protein n=1 Tax=Exophiala aquamarina CBS 119918 TaxID=1182545 RepID=A0A072P045_9EURO|nr:uncharacterized protein A1O9_11476 [Exophiala aquamarina CBS 119918]KEF52633.1 hypothetical protein A1O9_11476 [Exophiala aquamarina CBS 119918]